MPGPKLFEPISIRDVTLKNRVVVAPMHQYSAVKGFATDWHLMNVGRYAAGGAGLVFMESTKVERRGARVRPASRCSIFMARTAT